MERSNLHLTVLTPEEEYFKGEIQTIKVPGTAGQFQVLSNHAPIVSSLGEGEVFIRKTDGKEITFNIVGGFIEVLNNKVALLVQNIKE